MSKTTDPNTYECPRCARRLQDGVGPCGPEHAAWVRAARGNDRTHYPGCWRYHRECAEAEIERLAADIRDTLGALEGQVERLKGALERLGPTA